MSPRWFDKRTRRAPRARHRRRRARAAVGHGARGQVDTPYVKATGNSVLINLPKTPNTPEQTLEWKIPQWSNAIERDRARIYFVAYSAAMALHFLDKALTELRSGRTKVFEDFDGPRRGDRLRLPRGGARRALAPPGDPRRARSPTTTPTRRRRGTAARPTPTARRVPTRTRCRGSRSSRRTARRTSAGSTSCAPCAPSTRACRAACTCTWATAGRCEAVALADVRRAAR